MDFPLANFVFHFELVQFFKKCISIFDAFQVFFLFFVLKCGYLVAISEFLKQLLVENFPEGHPGSPESLDADGSLFQPIRKNLNRAYFVFYFFVPTRVTFGIVVDFIG